MKTIEQKQLEVKNYLTTSEQHLFKTNKGDLFKIIPFEVDGVLHVCKVTIKKDGTMTSKVKKVFTYESDNIKQNWKNYFFYKSCYVNEEAIAIKHFKGIRTFFSNLYGNLTINDEKNVEYMNKLVDVYKLSLNFVDKTEI
jgi:hypothetical protein